MDDLGLWRELRKVEGRLVYEDDPWDARWLMARAAAIRAQQRARRGRS